MRHVRSVVALLAVAALYLTGCDNAHQTKAPEWKSTDSSTKSQMSSSKTLYDRLGGEPAIRAVVDDFVPRAANDPKVNFARKDVPGAKEWQPTPENVERVKSGLVVFIGSATGGPQKYSGKDMKTLHSGMKITSAEFDAIAEDLKASLDKLNVPAKEQAELMSIVGTTRADIVEMK